MPERPSPRPPGHRPLLALIALLPLAAGATGLALTPGPEAIEAPRAEASAQAGGDRLWCPGPLQVPEEALEVGGDEELAVVPPTATVDLRTVSLEPDSSLLFGTVSGSETRLEEDGSVRAPSITAVDSEGTALPVPTVSRDLGASVQTLTEAEDAPLVETTGSAGGRPVADSVQTTATTSGDYRSLSMTRCTPATTDASFLGVSTQHGASSELVLRNTGERPATAAVQIWTEDGPAAMAGRSQVVVAPGTEERILLESVAPGHDAVGVRAVVLGAPLAMHVQTSRRDGLTPAGAEILGPMTVADRTLLLPGIRGGGRVPSLVIANPQGGDTTAAVSVLGPDGEVEGAGHDEVEIAAGAVVTVPLEGLTEADHTVRIESGEPLLAVVRSEVLGADLPGDTIGAPVDMALTTPAPALGTHAVTALPASGPAGRLVLTATEDTAVAVIPVGADGSAGEVADLDLTAGTTLAVPSTDLVVGGEPAAGISLVPETPGDVHATWVQEQSDGGEGVLISTLPVPAARIAEESVTVRLAP